MGGNRRHRALLEKVKAGFQTVGDLDRKAPWFQIREDKAAAGQGCAVRPGADSSI